MSWVRATTFAEGYHQKSMNSAQNEPREWFNRGFFIPVHSKIKYTISDLMVIIVKTQTLKEEPTTLSKKRKGKDKFE